MKQSYNYKSFYLFSIVLFQAWHFMHIIFHFYEYNRIITKAKAFLEKCLETKKGKNRILAEY